MQVAFIKNGIEIGTAFTDLDRNATYFATLGMRTAGEIMEANFGQLPFRYDIDTYVQDEWSRLMFSISLTTLTRVPLNEISSQKEYQRMIRPSNLKEKVLDPLIMGYLVHAGYLGSAEVFRKSVVEAGVKDGVFDFGQDGNANGGGGVGNGVGNGGGAGAANGKVEAMDVDVDADADMDDGAVDLRKGKEKGVDKKEEKGLEGWDGLVTESMRIRQDVRKSILSGEVTQAISLLDKHFPNLLPTRPHVHFDLLCREFIEHIASAYTGGPVTDAADSRSIELGRNMMTQFNPATYPDLRPALDEVFSLLAYPDPAAGPTGYLIRDVREAREATSSRVDGEILEEVGGRKESLLEGVVRQAVVCGGLLQGMGVSLVDVWRDGLDC
ncbi:hypothetical protein HDU97_007761 [Phlyctochytrium planicorne]|nr:hypothetical protein HDU97_007761 [Phlyctochytrium planicorne]